MEVFVEHLGDVPKKGVEEAIHHCLIHNTMLSPPRIDLVILNTVPVE